MAIPAKVNSIGAYAFRAVSGSFTVAAGNTHYKAVNGVLFDFAGNTLIQYPAGSRADSYTVPSGTKTIGECAFARSENLKTISVPDSVTEIRMDAFHGCDSLLEIILPSGLTKIEAYLFYECSSLTHVRIPSGVEGIGVGAFFHTKLSNLEYDGCPDCWKKIAISSDNPSLNPTCLYSDWKSNEDATCLTDGTKTKACHKCGELSTRAEDTVVIAGSKKPHNLSYRASGDVITRACKNTGCTFERKGTIKLQMPDKEYAYIGKAICPAEIVYSDNWEGKKDGVLTYTENVRPGTATAKLTAGGVSVQETFTIVNTYRPEEGKDYEITSKDSDTNLKVTAKKGYELSLTDTADGSWKNSLTAKKQIDGGIFSFYVRNTKTGEISLEAKESLRLSVQTVRTGNTNKLVASQKAESTDGKLTVTWQKVNAAKGYEIYIAKCNNRRFSKKPTKTIKKADVTSYTVSKVSGKKIAADAAYKIKIKSFGYKNGKKVYLGSTQTMYVVSSKNEIYTNAKKVTVSKKKVTLRAGKTSAISARIVKEDDNKKLLGFVARFRYYSADTSVATVNSRGKIRAVAPGTAKIYVVAANGAKATVTVRVLKKK